MTTAQRGLWGIDLLNVQRSDILSVTHLDYSARVQTVHEEANPRYHVLLKVFEAQTGYAVLVNTSFNVRGKPIVCTPEDAYRCFMRTEMDALVLAVYSTRLIRSRLKGIPTGKKNLSWIRCVGCTICGPLLVATVPTQLLPELFLKIVCWQRHRPNSLPMHLGSSSSKVV
jgi:hypothetical protein